MRRGIAALLVWLLIAPMAFQVAQANPAAFRASNSEIWVQVGSETPGPGCWVNTSVEVHSGNQQVSDIEVGLAFHVDSDVYYTSRGLTGADGIAFLGFDTVNAPSGRAAMLDVNIAGVYVGSVPLVVKDGWGCNDNPEVFEFGGAIPVSNAADASRSVPSSDSGSGIWVPAKYQQRGLSCEFASLSIAMAAYGYEVSEFAFDELVGRSQNPHWGFRGDIYGTWGGAENYGVYARPLANALPAFGFWGEEFYANGDASALTRRIDAGTPVLVWLALLGDTSYYEYTEDGTRYLIAPGQHTLVIYDYDEAGVYASDPALGAKRFYDWGWFMSMWNVFDGMGLAVGPA